MDEANKDTRSERPLFQGIDEFEREYAPEELPPDDPEQARVRADEGSGTFDATAFNEPPEPAPVANVGPSSGAPAAPPNIGREDHGGAPGDPQTEARYPIGEDERDETR
jgi:hypothetical protein